MVPLGRNEPPCSPGRRGGLIDTTGALKVDGFKCSFTGDHKVARLAIPPNPPGLVNLCHQGCNLNRISQNLPNGETASPATQRVVETDAVYQFAHDVRVFPNLKRRTQPRHTQSGAV